MTTVAFDGRYLVVDSKASRTQTGAAAHDNCPACKNTLTRVEKSTKKLRVLRKRNCYLEGHRIRAWAAAGSTNLIAAFEVALLQDIPLKAAGKLMDAVNATTNSMIEILVVTEGPLIKLSYSKGEFTTEIITAQYAALGSGGNVAQCMMETVGVSAIMAVATAIKHDKHTGYHLRYFDILTDEMAEISEEESICMVDTHFKK